MGFLKTAHCCSLSRTKLNGLYAIATTAYRFIDLLDESIVIADKHSPPSRAKERAKERALKLKFRRQARSEIFFREEGQAI